MQRQKQLRSFAVKAAQLMADRHCEDVRLVDVRGLSQVCDYVLIGTGTSDRQMRSVAQELEELGDEHENAVFRSSRDEGGTWIVIDFVDLVAHLFEPGQRTYYDLETLWSDGQTIEWEAQEKSEGRVSKAKSPRAAANRKVK
ncbi:MAG: ribosome silencing factor [Phycisphaerales bacterium]|nr:ribosome silencing factor [Phycisphaerales bacterium]MCI0631234.1 ribosome silencing factor [Phycisphaerales bacterium]MCI0677105.1 ribosome silencing factor [Phycisphaerales bacterium]